MRLPMFHKIKSVTALPEYKLSIEFFEGITKIHNVELLFERIPIFNKLKQHPEVFSSVIVDVGGYGILWDDELDISCDELWENGIFEDKLIEELKLGEVSEPSVSENPFSLLTATQKLKADGCFPSAFRAFIPLLPFSSSWLSFFKSRRFFMDFSILPRGKSRDLLENSVEVRKTVKIEEFADVFEVHIVFSQ